MEAGHASTLQYPWLFSFNTSQTSATRIPFSTTSLQDRKEAMSGSDHVHEEVVIVVCIHDPRKAH